MATNTHTGAVLNATTNGDGLYDFPTVPLGGYTLSFSKDGFNTFVRKGITLSLQTITINAKLDVGAVVEQVVVTSEAPLLETQTTEQQTTISEETIETVPVVGGQWLTMTELLPGVNGGGTQNASGQTIGVNGTQAFTANWLLGWRRGYIATRCERSRETFRRWRRSQEVNMNTSNFSAQYGNGAAGVQCAYQRRHERLARKPL